MRALPAAAAAAAGVTERLPLCLDGTGRCLGLSHLAAVLCTAQPTTNQATNQAGADTWYFMHVRVKTICEFTVLWHPNIQNVLVPPAPRRANTYSHTHIRVRFHIIRDARIDYVGKSRSCMDSQLRIMIWKQNVPPLNHTVIIDLPEIKGGSPEGMSAEKCATVARTGGSSQLLR